ncbi:hypothetical protein [Microlunatus endophyticus]|nr:hypothetical protein [Microlunatus endophyticus]
MFDLGAPELLILVLVAFGGLVVIAGAFTAIMFTVTRGRRRG